MIVRVIVACCLIMVDGWLKMVYSIFALWSIKFKIKTMSSKFCIWILQFGQVIPLGAISYFKKCN